MKACKLLIAITTFFILILPPFKVALALGETRASAINIEGKYIYNYTATTLRVGETWFKFNFPIAGNLTISQTPDEYEEDVNFYFDFFLGNSTQPFISKDTAHMLSYEDKNLTVNIPKTYQPIFVKITVFPQNSTRKLFALNFKFSIPTMQMQIGNPTALLGDKEYSMDVAPIIVFSRTMVPIRFISEAFGLKVDWYQTNKKVVITGIDKQITLYIGKKTITVSGKTIESDVAPTIINNRTFIPLRVVAEILGANVSWNDYSKTITIEFSQNS